MTGNPSNPDPVTCAQLSGLLNATNAWLYQISQAIKAAGTGGGTPVDLTAITATLANLATGVNIIPQAISVSSDTIAAPLNTIADAIAKNSGIDVSGIVEQLKTMADQGDVPQTTLDAMAQAGLISPNDLQNLQGASWSKVISWVTSSAPVRALEGAIANADATASAVAAALKTELAPAGNWAEQKIIGAAKTERNGIQAVLTPLIEAIAAQLKPAGAVTLGSIGVNPDKVVADVVAVGLNLFVVATLIGFFSHGAASELKELIEITLGIVGLEELREVQIGPLVEEGIAKIATYQARARFQQELPSTSTMQGWVAQGLFDGTRARALSLFNGTPDEIFPVQQKASYRGLNPRQMLRLIETGLFSDAEIADELTFSAMRPTSQARMRRAAPYLATAGLRTSLIAALETLAIAGLLDDSSLTAQVDAAEQNDDRDSLILSRVHLQQLVQETKDLETEYVTLFVAGVIDDVTFRNSLAALGLQPWRVNTVAAKAEAKANATLHRKEIAAAAAQAKALQREIDAAATKNFLEGNIDATALGAALIASGVTVAQSSALVDLAVLRKGGALRWIYGQQLPPLEANLLRQRVAALTDQRKRLQITQDQYVSQLRALGIGDRYVNALDAAAEATITPKTSATAIPVKTN